MSPRMFWRLGGKLTERLLLEDKKDGVQQLDVFRNVIQLTSMVSLLTRTDSFLDA